MPKTEAQKRADKKYQQSDKGKAAKKRRNKRYNQSDKGKAAQKRKNRSDKGKARRKRHNKTDKGRDSIERYNYSDKGKAVRKRAMLKFHYGLSFEDYNKLIEKQEGKCAICRRLDDNICVDHDHVSNKIRGLLCNKCNLILGLAGDNKDILLNAINYLKETV